MAFFDFRIAEKIYDVNDVTDHVNSTHDALVPLSAEARLYSLTRREGTNDMFVATIVGDECRVPAINKWRHTFAVFEDCSSSSADKIAVMRVLQYLNNEEYKKLWRRSKNVKKQWEKGFLFTPSLNRIKKYFTL